MTDKPLALFTSYCSSIYGTERMLLATAEILSPEFDTCLLSPEGLLQREARDLGMQALSFAGRGEFVSRIRQILRERRDLAVFTTSAWHSVVFAAVNAVYRRRAAHFHMVHGGSPERDSYSRKHHLKPLNLRFVCPSPFVRERLSHYGVPGRRVTVVPNFLSDSRVTEIIAHPRFEADGVRSVVVVSRVDPIKRVDLLMDMLDRCPEFDSMPIRVVGGGGELQAMERRASSHPQITFTGPSSEALREIGSADLLLHLCPEEPFGLVILEAFASGVPVLVPDRGGAAGIVDNLDTGYVFRSNDVDSLAAALRALRQMPGSELNRVAAAARDKFESTYRSPMASVLLRDLIRDGFEGQAVEKPRSTAVNA